MIFDYVNVTSQCRNDTAVRLHQPEPVNHRLSPPAIPVRTAAWTLDVITSHVPALQPHLKELPVPTLTIHVPEALEAFLQAAAAAAGAANPSDYIAALLRTEQVRAEQARLEALLLEALPASHTTAKPAAESPPGAPPVAEADIQRHAARYAAQNRPAIAVRFEGAARNALATLGDQPGAERFARDPRLAGLCARQIKGFAEFWIWYLPGPIPLRILHQTRDVTAFPQTAKA